MRRIAISSKGRVTIPAVLRKKLGLNPGTLMKRYRNTLNALAK